jgi:PAS domain S-box-containing protein
MRTAPVSPLSVLRLCSEIILLALLYYGSARMGLSLAFANTNATPVWPPAGIALAALILRGSRLWPGVWLGAFAGNVVTFYEHGAASAATVLGVSAVIATGNTLGVLTGWRICRGWLEWNDDGTPRLGRDPFFGRMNVFQFLGAASGAALVSALVGPLVVCGVMLGSWESYRLIAFTWWSGDATGILYLTPFLISLAGLVFREHLAKSHEARRAGQAARLGSWEHFWEPASAFAMLIVASWAVFAIPSVREFPGPLLKCLPLVALTWIAVRMGARATTFALMILGVFVVWSGRKFFGSVDVTSELEKLLAWLAVLWVVAFMFLALGAAVDAHRSVLQSLREAKAALEATMDAIPAIVTVAHDAQCQHVTGNAPAHELFQVPVGGNLSVSPGATTTPDYEILPSSRGPFMETLPMQKAAATGRPVLGKELEVHFPDGDVRVIYGNAVPLLDESGKSRGCVAAFVDVTDRRKVEEALSASQRQLADDLDAMTRMQQLSARIVGADDFEELMPEILDTAIEISHADMGYIQLIEDEVLRMVVQRGFEAPFLDYFNSVHHDEAASGTAMRYGARLIVDDVATSPVFAGNPALEVMLNAGALAVQSTPLVSRSGRVLGMFSTHYRTPQRPSDQALRLLDILARQAADLIERTQTERVLRESEERFRTMADVAPVMIWMSGLDQMFQYVNEPWREFTGRTMEQEMGHGWAESVHPDDLERCFDIRTACLHERQAFRMEYRIQRHDGEYRWLLDHGVPRFGAAGEFVGFIGSCVDITDRRQGESDMALLLHLSEQRRTASSAEKIVTGTVDTLGPHLDADNCWFATVDAAGETFSIGPGHQAGADSLEATFCMSTFGPDVVKMLRAGHIVTLADVAGDGHTNARSEGYERLKIGACAMVPILRDGRIVAMLALTTRGSRAWSQRDVSMLGTVTERMWLAMERLRLAAQLSESEARFRTMAEWVPVFIFTTGADGKLDYINERFSAFTGLRLQSLTGDEWMQAVHPDDRTGVAEQWQGAIKNAQPFSTGLRIVAQDGSYHWFHCQAHPVHDDHGRIVKWFGSCADIDELMRSQSDLRALNERLEEKVGERTAQLITAHRELERGFIERQRLEQEMLDISEKERRMLGEDLHDGLCQHLSGLALMAETLSFKMREKGIEEESAKLDGLTRLIRSAASQARAVAKGLHPVDMDANGLVAALRDLATRHSTKDEVHCELRCSRPVPLQDNHVALHLYRIAQEAVVNALKHAGAKEIVIDLRTSGNQIDLSVIDDGRGFAQNQKLNGGMGLHLMRYRAGVIGGTLAVQPSSSGGTVVKCAVPIKEAEVRDTATGPVPLVVRRREAILGPQPSAVSPSQPDSHRLVTKKEP